MFRVRYYNQGRELTLTNLNVLQRDLTVLWVVSGGHPVLFVNAGNEALLQRALETLPLVRLSRASFDPRERLGAPIPLSLDDVPPDRAHRLALALGRGAVRLAWRDGLLRCFCLAPQEVVVRALGEVWPEAEAMTGWRRVKTHFVKGIALPPGRIALPDVDAYPTLASRNGALVGDRVLAGGGNLSALDPSSTDGLPLARQEADGRPVPLPIPLRGIWCGLTPAIPQALQQVVDAWLKTPSPRITSPSSAEQSSSAEQPPPSARQGETVGRDVIVLDGVGWSARWETDSLISWPHPGQGERVNPLEPIGIGVEDAAAYAELVLEWLAALGINETLIGAPVYRLLRVALKLWGHNSLMLEDEPLSPPIIASVLDRPEQTEDLRIPPLDAEDRGIWVPRNWTSARANLMPAAARLKGLLEQPQLGVLWCPPFSRLDPSVVLRELSPPLPSPRLTVLAPGGSRATRAFLASSWLPLRHRLSPHTLVLGVGIGELGERVLADARARNASVLLWGERIAEAGGETLDLSDVELLVSRSPDAPALAELVGVPCENLLAQADHQLIVRLGDQVGALVLPGDNPGRRESSVSRSQPPLPARVSAGAESPQGISSPSGAESSQGTAVAGPLVVLGPVERVSAFFRAWVARQGRVGEPTLLINGNGSAPSLPGVQHRDLPRLNPLYPRSLPRWLWWARGAGLPDALMRRAWENGVDDLDGLAVLAESTPHAERARQLAESEHFDRGTGNPLADWNGTPVALTSEAPAATYALLAASLDAGRQVLLWQPGVSPSPAVLRRLRAVVYAPGAETLVPELETSDLGATSGWSGDLPLLVLGDGSGVPEALRGLAQGLGEGEGLLIKPGSEVRRVRV